MFYIYLLECKDGSIYTGFTTDLKRRFNEHCSGRGGSYTRSKGAKRILYFEQFESRSSALKREAEIKGWRKNEKIRLINEQH